MPGFCQSLPNDAHRAVEGALGSTDGDILEVIKLRPLVLGCFIQGENVIAPSVGGAQINPGGNQVHVFQINRSVGVFTEGHGEPDTVLGVAVGLALHNVCPLVGNGVAHGVQAHGFVVGVNGAGQQRHRLHHMGMTAHNHINAQVAQLLGNLGLVCHRCQGIFHAPLQENDQRLSALTAHLLNIAFHLGIEWRRVIGDEGVHHVFCPFVQQQTVEVHPIGVAVIRPALIGVAEHSNLNAVDVFNGILRFIPV